LHAKGLISILSSPENELSLPVSFHKERSLMDGYPTRFITDVLSNIHLSLPSVASSQSARVMLANKEADLQELAAELKTLELQLRTKGSALRAQQRR
jgi:hypothetical protein